VIRLFKVYYPVRTVVLLGGEALIVGFSLVLGAMAAALLNPVSSLQLRNAFFIEGEYLRIPGLASAEYIWILGLTAAVLLLSHVVDLYDSSRLGSRWEERTSRILLVPGVVAITLALAEFACEHFLPGQHVLPGAQLGVVILALMLLGWRWAFASIIKQPYFRERVYVLGDGDRAQRLVDGLEGRSAMGIDVVGWTGEIFGELTRERVADHLFAMSREKGVQRVIVAMDDRRGTLPVDELLELRLKGVKVEEATSWLEKISGRIEVEQLNPSWLIFGEGFHFNGIYLRLRRVFSTVAAGVGLLVALPLLPFIILAIRLDSPGRVFYQQKRVGRKGHHFICYKFRTMRQDAEADTGATWATDDDPRITRVGKVLRLWRLDEIPQLWCVLKGDMDFVGPRPERPEFVEKLSREIRHYDLRHVVRPGITGWAQVNYKYGNTLEDAQEKLQYDLFYIKNASLGLDLWIVFQTLKIVLLGRYAI